MKRILIILHNLVVLSCLVPYTLAVINVTITGTTTRHVCKGEHIDFKWTYDDTDPDKDFIKTIQWSKDPSGYLIMQYETATNDLSITSNPNDYTARVERTTEAGSNDIGMRLIKAGSTSVDDEGKYYVSLIVDKPGGDANDYFVPYRDPQGVTVYVCVGVDDTFPLPSLSLTYDETTQNITCSGPSSLGNTTFAIFDPSMNTVVDSTTDTTISKDITADPPGGTYRCKTYCTEQGFNDTPQGTCLPTDATLVMPGWGTWEDWSSCASPATSRTRIRACNNPAPALNGPQNCPSVNTETEICPTCNPNPCANGGTCMSITNGFICNCPDSHTGIKCAELKTEVQGNCSNETNVVITLDDDNMICHFTVEEKIPCIIELQDIPDECFNVTLELLPLVTDGALASSPGLAYNIHDGDDFDMIYFRVDDQNCFEVASFVEGSFEATKVDCGSFNITTDWFAVELHVCNTTVLLQLNGNEMEWQIEAKHDFFPSLGLVQGPEYNDECSLDCQFQFRNLYIYPAYGPDTGETIEMDGFCSSPIRGGCLALIIVFVILYLINIYVLILICHTFVKRVDGGIPLGLKIIVVIVVIFVPLLGAVCAAVYVYTKHRKLNEEEKIIEHSEQYFVFLCPCEYRCDSDSKYVPNGRGSSQSNKSNIVCPSPDQENNTQKPPASFTYEYSQKSKSTLPPLGTTATYDAIDADATKQKKKKKKRKKNKKQDRDEKEKADEI